MKKCLLLALILVGNIGTAKACQYMYPMTEEKYKNLVVDAHTIITGRVVELKSQGHGKVLVTILRSKLWKGTEMPLIDFKISQNTCSPRFEINRYYIVALTKDFEIAGRGAVEPDGSIERKHSLLKTLNSMYGKEPKK